MYSTLTNFSQRKRKTYDANYLLALLFVSVIFFILLEIFFIVHQQQQHMISSYTTPFNEKMCKQLLKIWRKKKRVSAFSTLSIDDMKTKKKHKYVLLV